jgi:hypothetical protein
VDRSHLTGRRPVCFLCDPEGAEIHKSMGEHLADQHPEVAEQVADAPIVDRTPIAYRCRECGRAWTIDDDPQEWAYGHDCEVE